MQLYSFSSPRAGAYFLVTMSPEPRSSKARAVPWTQVSEHVDYELRSYHTPVTETYCKKSLKYIWQISNGLISHSVSPKV